MRLFPRFPVAALLALAVSFPFAVCHARFIPPQVDIVPPIGGAGNLSPIPGEVTRLPARLRERNTAVGRWLTPVPTSPPTLGSETLDDNTRAFEPDNFFRFTVPYQFVFRFKMGPLE